MRVRAYRYASVDASKMAQKLRREIWCRSITAAYRTCVYLKNLARRAELVHCSKGRVAITAAFRIVKRSLLVVLRQKVKMSYNSDLRHIRYPGIVAEKRLSGFFRASEVLNELYCAIAR